MDLLGLQKKFFLTQLDSKVIDNIFIIIIQVREKEFESMARKENAAQCTMRLPMSIDINEVLKCKH